jgi:hypothetical protein
MEDEGLVPGIQEFATGSVTVVLEMAIFRCLVVATSTSISLGVWDWYCV